MSGPLLLRVYTALFFLVCVSCAHAHVQKSNSGNITNAGNPTPRSSFGDLHVRKRPVSGFVSAPSSFSVGHGISPSRMSLQSGRYIHENDGGLSFQSHRANLNRKESVSPVVAQMLYEDMLLGRGLEDACARLYYAGRTNGFVHLYTGQEAVSTGVIKLLRKDDAIASTYRDHVHALSKGIPARGIMAELFGKATGCSKGHGGSMHMFSKEFNVVGGFAFIGEQIPVALGFAYAQAYRKFAGKVPDATQDQVTVCFMGDGTTNIGQFYESMNMAALMKLPIIFVVENNNWAIGMAAQRSTAVQDIYKRGPPFGLPSVQVDGMDVLAVRTAARQAIDRARRGEGPTLMEALTYRFRGHSLADPDELRSRDERNSFSVRDPIKAFETYMQEMQYGNDTTFKNTRDKVKAIIDDAVTFAENSPDPDVSTCGDAIFAPAYTPRREDDELTPEQLEGYARALKDELDRAQRKLAGDRSPPPPLDRNTDPMTVID